MLTKLLRTINQRAHKTKAAEQRKDDLKSTKRTTAKCKCNPQLCKCKIHKTVVHRLKDRMHLMTDIIY